MLKAFHVSECEIYAAESAEQSRADYERETGEQCVEGYPHELSEAELDAPQPEFDEDERQTGGVTTVRQMLAEHGTEPGFLAGTDW